MAVLGKIFRRILTPLIDAASSLLARERLETLILVDDGRLLLARSQKRKSAGLVDLISWSTNDVDVMKMKRGVNNEWTRRSDSFA